MRAVLVGLASDLDTASAPSASVLRRAAQLRTTPTDELLAMREALVRTRPDWDVPAVAGAGRAAKALRRAKRLAIEL